MDYAKIKEVVVFVLFETGNTVACSCGDLECADATYSMAEDITLKFLELSKEG